MMGLFKGMRRNSHEDEMRKRMFDAVKRAQEEDMPDSMSAAQIGQALASAANMIDKSVGVQHVAAVNFPHVTPGNQHVQGNTSQVISRQGWVNPPEARSDGANNKAEHLFRMLAMRMRWDTNVFASRGYNVPFHGITLLERGDGVVLILIATGTDHVLLEDDGQMFPSDNLITKLRVLTP